jgi:putative membrane protein
MLRFASSGGLPGVLLAGYAVWWLVLAIHPVNRQDWVLENLLVFLALPPLLFTRRRFTFSNASYSLITVFLALHAVGAHYTYSEVPFFNWVRDGFSLDRNHYDRIVHFLFGFLLSLPLWEVLTGVIGLRPGWARLGAVHVVMAWSAAYEMIEALVAHLVSPELGAAYNGTQGDIWDAQKDAALAMLGAIVVMTVAGLWAWLCRARAEGAAAQR